MYFNVVICPKCQLQSSPGAPVCHNCGEILNPEELEAIKQPRFEAPEDLDSAGSPVPEEMLLDILRESKMKSTRTSSGWKVEVAFEPGQSQIVEIVFNGRDRDGHPLMSFLSICGLFNEAMATRLLRQNTELTYSAFAIWRHMGKDCIVVLANQLASALDRQEIEKTLYEVAYTANRMGKKLGAG